MSNCTISWTMEEIDGLCKVDDNDFRDPNKQNYIELTQPIFDDDKYHQQGKRLASYDSTTGIASFIMPQGSVVNLQLDIIGITLQSNKAIPAQASIDLNDLLVLWA